MITSRDLDNQIVSSGELEQRDRGPGRRPVAPRVVTSVKLPEPLYDEYCRASLACGASVHALLVKAIEAYVAPTESHAAPALEAPTNGKHREERSFHRRGRGKIT